MTATQRRLLLHQAVPMRDGVNLSADVWLPPLAPAGRSSRRC